MTEITCTVDIQNNPELSKALSSLGQTISDVQVVELCDKKTGEKHKFVSIDRVLAVLDIESTYLDSIYAYGDAVSYQEYVRRFTIMERVFKELKEGEE